MNKKTITKRGIAVQGDNFQRLIKRLPNLPDLTNVEYKSLKEEYGKGNKKIDEMMKLFLFRCVAENVAMIYEQKKPEYDFQEMVSCCYQKAMPLLKSLLKPSSVSNFRSLVYTSVYRSYQYELEKYRKNLDVYLICNGAEKVDVCEIADHETAFYSVSDSVVIRKELLKEIEKAFRFLSPRQKAVVATYYGFLDGGRGALTALSNKWGATRAMASLVKKQGLKRIMGSESMNRLAEYRDFEFDFS